MILVMMLMMLMMACLNFRKTEKKKTKHINTLNSIYFDNLYFSLWYNQATVSTFPGCFLYKDKIVLGKQKQKNVTINIKKFRGKKTNRK